MPHISYCFNNFKLQTIALWYCEAGIDKNRNCSW